jgi:hydrogenase maturation factor HypE
MSSALLARGNAIFPDTGVDLSAAVGKLVTFSAGVPAVSASATVPATGIVLDASTRTVTGNTVYENSIGILGALPGPVYAKISGSATAIGFGDTLQQAADGTLTNDAGTGARVVVGVCADKNGAVAGDMCTVAFFSPQIRS